MKATSLYSLLGLSMMKSFTPISKRTQCTCWRLPIKCFWNEAENKLHATSTYVLLRGRKNTRKQEAVKPYLCELLVIGIPATGILRHTHTQINMYIHIYICICICPHRYVYIYIYMYTGISGLGAGSWLSRYYVAWLKLS